MSVDIVDIALARLTDWATFEQMAGEIMRNEGYPGIKLLGGVQDGGQDANVEQFFESDRMRTRIVFQFTLREDAVQKAKETIARLDETGTKFQKLVLVTPRHISAQAQQAASKAARERGVELDIFERDTILNRLADFGNQIFHRVFPNINTQLAGVLCHRDETEAGARAAREKEYLKVCCAIVFNPEGRRARKYAIDRTVLAVMYHHRDTPLTPAEVLKASQDDLGKGVLADEKQVSASLRRLAKDDYVKKDPPGERYVVSPGALTFIEARGVAQEAESESVIRDIAEEVCETAETPVPQETRQRLERNAYDMLVEHFRLNGLELAASFLGASGNTPAYVEGLDRLSQFASRGVPKDLGNLLITAVAGTISNPTDEEARLFARWSRAYLVLHLMNVDPSLREFQSTRLKTKTFLLDTDVVLESIIEELPRSSIYRNLSADLVSRNAKVLIPEAVLQEVITHLEISPRTYRRFGAPPLSMPQELVSMGVHNALVRGFWYYRGSPNRAQVDFEIYRANYYDTNDPRRFVIDVIHEALPGVSIQDPVSSDAVTSMREKFPELGKAMCDIAARAEQSEYRREDETAELAEHDTELMLSILKLNQDMEEDGDSVLGARAYIITASSRYVRSASRCDIRTSVSTSPHVLAGLLEIVSPNSISDGQFVALFENPLLQQVAEACWDDLLALLDFGIDLRGKSLTRLRHDYERVFQANISGIAKVNEKDSRAILGAYSELGGKATDMGYGLSPALARVREVSETQQNRIDELLRENQELRDAIKDFGRRKERWLRRQDRKRKES